MSYRKDSRSGYPKSYSRRPRGAYSPTQQRSKRGPKKDYIDPSRFIKAAAPSTAQVYVPKNSFADFGVAQIIKANLASKGITTPTQIQDQAIPFALDGRDIIGIANTGTGKTAAFAIPILDAVMTSGARALIIAPTRELAQQIDAECQSIAQGTRVRTAVLIGGAGMGLQFKQLKNQPHLVIGTPGRIKDHLNRGSLRLGGFTHVVLDEVDRMLDMGFVHDVSSILDQLVGDKQSFFFSATITPKVNSLIETFANDPVTISVKNGDTGENIHQNEVRISRDGEKLDTLHDLLIRGDIQKVIIFDDTQRSVERLSDELVLRGFKADAIHGGKSQAQRQRSLHKFKQNEVTILVATDVAARGIDVPDITHVINYSTPGTYDDYVHRIGRAGRAGNVGYALTFVAN